MTSLVDRARDYLGGLDFQAAYRLHTRPDAVAVVAGFAAAVAQAASEGDAVATHVLTSAITALARTAQVGAAQCGSPIVSWAGGMFHMGAQLLEPLAAALASSGARLVAPAAGSLDGAMALCQLKNPLYRSMVTTTSEWAL
jgi:N-acetylglucosamine kinase-like BadF-type ATPase